ncbi:phage tail protein [Acinetobacter baumannii]|uniref:phage tail-collar fiber domain-containing protein n=1 Tax=Acinetobacter baumannii TaxID=470 RepID=UPI003AF961EC
MSSPYYNVTTNAGDAAIANAIATNTKLNITHVAFGDGNGSSPSPDKTRTTLVKEVYRQGVNKYEKHPTINNFIEVEAILPSIVGSFYIREIGLIVDGKTLISHGAVAPVFKEANSVREYRLRFTINIQDAEIVNVMLDDTLIYATQGWVDDNYVPRDEIIDNLVTNDPTKPLSAKQGKNLQDNKLDKTANAVGLQTKDNRTLRPSELSQAIQAFFGTLDSNNNSSFFCDYLTLNGWTDSSGGLKNALVFSKTGQSLHHFQADYTSDTWTIKKQIAYTDSSISGNAASATKLQNARRINNELFDGTSDITILDNTKFKADGPTASVNDVAWNAKSGVYTKLEGGGTSTVLHFLGSGSAPAFQFLINYRNGGLWYRSARDTVGFEESYERIITEKGGTVKGSLSTNGISNTGDISTTGELVAGSIAGEARLRLAGTNRYLYLNAGSWGVWTDKGSEPLSKVCGGTGRTDGAAEKLVTPRQVSFSGAAIGSFTYDGSVNSSCVLTLANSGVVAGTYASTIQIPSLTVNDKGLITGVSQQSIRSASTNQTGVVQLADDLVSDDSSKALTAKQGKNLQDQKLAIGQYGFGGVGSRVAAPTSDIDLIKNIYGKSQFVRRDEGTSSVPNYAAGIFGQTDDTYFYLAAGYSGGGVVVLAGNSFGVQNNLQPTVYKLATLSDNVASASKLANIRNISFSGAATGSFNFDGSGNVSCILTLANSGVVAGTYASTIQIPSITVNNKGLITGITQQTIRSASVTQSGVVQLADDLVSDDSSKALSAKQGKNLQDNKLDKTANAVGLQTKDNRILKPSELSQAVQAFFGTLDSNSNSGFFCDYLTLNGWIDSSGGLKNALVFSKTGQSLHHFQAEYTSDTWTIKKQIAYTDSSISGNAASATKLQNARRINNELFDGTSDITILDNTKFKADGPTASVNDVAWNAKSGVYTKLEGGWTSTVVHFLGSGSASALQFLTGYGNGGLYYRSSRDGVGFENEYEKIITEKGGTVKGGLSTNGISNTGDFSTTGDIVTGSTAGEARLRLAGTNRYLYLNAGSWGVWTDNGSEPLSKVCGGTGRTDGAAEKLVTARQISLSGAVSGSALFDGSGNINISTVLNNFGSLKSGNGYKYLGDGLILQWGTMDYTSYPGETKVDITFPITFPNNVLNINSTRKMAQHSGYGDGGVLLVSQSNSGASFSLNVFNSSAIGDLRGFTWFAIGY